jgi:hypothetical protein
VQDSLVSNQPCLSTVDGRNLARAVAVDIYVSMEAGPIKSIEGFEN